MAINRILILISLFVKTKFSKMHAETPELIKDQHTGKHGNDNTCKIKRVSNETTKRIIDMDFQRINIQRVSINTIFTTG
jgi:hypothetical protein